MRTIVSRHFQAFFLSSGISLLLALFAVLYISITLSLLFDLSLPPSLSISLFFLSFSPSLCVYFPLSAVPFRNVSRHCL